MEQAHPSNKKELLEEQGYEMFKRDLMRLAFPRIIKEVKQIKPSAKKIGDIISFYFAVLSYIDGNEKRKDGQPNDRYGYAYPTQAMIQEITGIDRKRHKELTQILQVNGILLEVVEVYEGTKRYLRYKPSYCPRISADGFLVDNNGEKITPNYDGIL